VTGNDLALTALILLWFGAIAAALIGAVPLVTTLIPVVHSIVPVIAEHASIDTEVVSMALWWSLALGACLGGNGTMFGTAANVVVVQIAKNNNRDITFFRFMAYGLPVMLMTLAISTVYILLRYVP
jgi:Na+/H+ antiporter NhaD/arsenite permease-like protein